MAKLMKRSGFSLVELLIVMAIIGVLAAIIGPSLNQPRPAVLANAVQAGMQSARFEAIKRNRAVVFAWDSTAQQFIVRVKNESVSAASAQKCSLETGDVDLTPIRQSAYPRLKILTPTFAADTTATNLRGLVWQPYGLPKQCSTGALSDGRFDIALSASTTAAVKVVMSAAGRIRQE